MMRALIDWLLSWAAYQLARLAARLLPPPPAPPVAVRVHPELRAPEHDKYAHDLASLEHAKVDAVLAYVLGAEGANYFMGHFSRQADPRWRQ